MINMYKCAVQYGYMNIDQVPTLYQDEVKRSLGIEDPEPIIEDSQPVE